MSPGVESPQVVLLTGASGLLGTWLRRTVPDGTEVVSVTHRSAIAGSRTVTADLRDARAIADAVERVRPAVILHAAMALDEASIVDATAHVVDAAAGVGAAVVHVSTDAVFSGDGRPVHEDASPDPVFAYGRWKADAEVVAAGSPVPSCVVRLPLVVSLDPADAAVARIRDGDRDGVATHWFNDEFRRPAMAQDIAAGLWRIAALPHDRRAGAWHLGGPEVLSRYDIASRVTAALGIDERAVVGEPAPTDVARPRHIDLRSERAIAEIAWHPAPILR